MRNFFIFEAKTGEACGVANWLPNSRQKKNNCESTGINCKMLRFNS